MSIENLINYLKSRRGGYATWLQIIKDFEVSKEEQDETFQSVKYESRLSITHISGNRLIIKVNPQEFYQAL